MPDVFLTASEVAELLRLNVETVYSLAQKGELPGAKIGGQWRFLSSDVTRWFRSRAQRHRDGGEDQHVQAHHEDCLRSVRPGTQAPKDE